MSTTGSAAKVEWYIDKIRRLADERLTPAQSDLFEPFASRYFARTAVDDLAERPAEELYGAAMAHFTMGRHRPPGDPLVRVYNPDAKEDGYTSTNSVVEIAGDDMPFLVDSVSMEVTRHGYGIYLVVHPVIRVVRDAAGNLTRVLPHDEAPPPAPAKPATKAAKAVKAAEAAAEAGPAPEEGAPAKPATKAAKAAEAAAEAELTPEEGAPAKPARAAKHPADESRAESFIRLEIDRRPAGELEQLRDDLVRVLGDVRSAVEDWEAMRDRALDIAKSLDEDAAAIPAADRKEAAAFLEWLAAGHFVFIGYRDYELVDENGADVLRSIEGTGLGILRGTRGRPTKHSYSQLPPDVRRRARERNLLNLTKANSHSTVHRSSYLDYIGVKRLDESGSVVAERRFLGLYTSNAYKQWPHEIPILRRTVGAVLERAGFPADSHDGKRLAAILDAYPRDELFQSTPDELFEAAMAVLGLQERRRLRVIVRHDQFGRFVSCLVFLPRDRHTPATEQRIQDILLAAFHGQNPELTTTITESVLVRLHFVIYTEPGTMPRSETDEIERQLTLALRTWSEDLHDALVEELGEELGTLTHRRYGNAFSAAYIEEATPAEAVSDIRHLEVLEESGGFAVDLHRLAGPEGNILLQLFRSGGPIMLSEVLPLIENMGLQVVDERPYEIHPEGADTVWEYDFGVRYAGDLDLADEELRARFHEAFTLVWTRQIENDGFNRLVLGAGIDARDISLLRTYARYLRQTGTASGLTFIGRTLVNHPRLARLLVDLFHTRFDPDGEGGEARELASKELAGKVERGLEAVASLNEDRILRRMLATVMATLRTNFFQVDEHGEPKEWIAVKLDARRVPDLPLPVPMFETFVSSPKMEGIHLRGGWVARGGLRWSDRPEDYRTEVLGLMKAQTVKNAVIVPVGAKGGFVVKSPSSDRDELASQGVGCYRTFVRGLLDVTDNLIAGEPVGPPRTVCHDGTDAYLVVAADKGTATFSDIANELATERGFWLGDAFASGGSAGYDHKAMGITARGAWVSVRRHLHELGIDPAVDGITAVGIGDMSGDVFGNGMLLEPNLRLIAAFDHRNIFLDPEPDPAVSFAERRRLFGVPGSSWEDYDESTVSTGGGVWGRRAKAVQLSPQIRAALAIEDETLTPDELIRAILKAPVDLLWNGGIGTYVCSSHENLTDVGDRSNDHVRVRATDLRCKVVGEGGNLGFTQLARIEFAQRGGRIFTDAIDNSAGVDTSDHEVNIKILLDKVVGDGGLTLRQRDDLLHQMTDEVARHVLADNEGQTLALSLAAAQARSMAPVHLRLLASLERSGRLNRAIEYLPSGDELRERIDEGSGLTTPELAVLMAYAKSDLYGELLASDITEDAFLSGELQRYFPAALRTRYSTSMSSHPLRREIIATRLTNEVINRAGMTYAFRLSDETGLSKSDVVRAHAAAHEIFGIGTVWTRTERLGTSVSAAVQQELFREARTLTERAGRRLLAKCAPPLDVAETVDHNHDGLQTLADRLPDLLSGKLAQRYRSTTARLVAQEVPEALAGRVAGLPILLSGLDVVDLARSAGCDLEDAAVPYFALGDVLSLDWISDGIAALPRDDRWHGLARAALRQELYAVRAVLTAAVLRDGPDTGTGPARVRAWLDELQPIAGRCVATLDEIVASGRADIATLSVALNEVRNLTAEGED